MVNNTMNVIFFTFLTFDGRMIAIKNVVRKPFDGVSERDLLAKVAGNKEASYEAKLSMGIHSFIFIILIIGGY